MLKGHQGLFWLVVTWLNWWQMSAVNSLFMTWLHSRASATTYLCSPVMSPLTWPNWLCSPWLVASPLLSIRFVLLSIFHGQSRESTALKPHSRVSGWTGQNIQTLVFAVWMWKDYEALPTVGFACLVKIPLCSQCARGAFSTVTSSVSCSLPVVPVCAWSAVTRGASPCAHHFSFWIALTQN